MDFLKTGLWIWDMTQIDNTYHFYFDKGDAMGGQKAPWKHSCDFYEINTICFSIVHNEYCLDFSFFWLLYAPECEAYTYFSLKNPAWLI